jgi:mgtE-like transporter
MKEFWRIVIQGSSGLSLAFIIELVGGGLLEVNVSKLIMISYILFLIPAVNNMTGTLGTVIVARISTSLHLGIIEPKLFDNKELKYNFLGVVYICIIVVIYLQIISLILFHFLNFKIVSILHILLITITPTLLAIFLTVITGIILTIVSFNNRLDPNILIMSLITALGDLFGIGSVLLVAKILGMI